MRRRNESIDGIKFQRDAETIKEEKSLVTQIHVLFAYVKTEWVKENIS
jgi:hypothetical protein